LRAHNPLAQLAAGKQQLREMHRRLGELLQQRLMDARQRHERLAGMLRILGPEATLERGYSITRDARGNIIRKLAQVAPRMKIRTRIRDGEFGSRVE
jgi:exodeoxyribonuclease VII large subunit